MKTSTNNNSLTITWAIIEPTKGKSTKRDLNVFYKQGILTIGGDATKTRFTAWFSNKEKALELINNVKGLNKSYKITLITDKQFGNSTWNQATSEMATTLQRESAFLIN